MDEQIYPVEKSTDIELVATMSAFQIRWMLRASDPEAMFDAARGYLRTAEKLDALADGIHQNSTDLAAAWHGAAAAESQEQLRRFCGSARSLAAAARSSAIAVDHAAQALALAKYRASMLPGGNLPSTDPHSMQSWSHQAVLADLNSAYRDSTAMAPNQLAVSLPRSDEQTQYAGTAEWESMPRRGGHNPGNMAAGASGGYHPQRLPSLIPSNPGGHHDVPMSRSHDGAERLRSLYTQLGSGAQGDSSAFVTEGPYDVGSQLAGTGGGTATGGIATGPIAGRSDIREPWVGGSATGSAVKSTPVRGGRSVLGSEVGGQSGLYPSASGRQDERDRERRYYLKEEREVWGEQFTSPAVLYGEYSPPISNYDEDDDF